MCVALCRWSAIVFCRVTRHRSIWLPTWLLLLLRKRCGGQVDWMGAGAWIFLCLLLHLGMLLPSMLDFAHFSWAALSSPPSLLLSYVSSASPQFLLLYHATTYHVNLHVRCLLPRVREGTMQACVVISLPPPVGSRACACSRSSAARICQPFLDETVA